MITFNRLSSQLMYASMQHLSKSNEEPLSPALMRRSSSFDESCYSLASTSCSSSAASSVTSEEGKRVTFSDTSKVHLVQRLYPRERLNEYFYSLYDEKKATERLRLEKKILFKLGVKPGANGNNFEEELQELAPLSEPKNLQISQVIIFHNEQIKTYCDKQEQAYTSQDSSYFFDNDSFWNGTMTFN